MEGHPDTEALKVISLWESLEDMSEYTYVMGRDSTLSGNRWQVYKVNHSGDLYAVGFTGATQLEAWINAHNYEASRMIRDADEYKP